MRALFAGIAFLCLFTAPAAAATTVFGASVFATTGAVLSPGAAVGVADGASATIQRVPGGSSLVLQMSTPTTGASTILNGQRTTAGSIVQIAIGEVIAGVATFSANVNLPGGLASVHTLDLSAACASVSAAGCSLLRIRVTAPPGGGFTLDGLSGVSVFPEPSAWALMILGFGAVAWRLKTTDRRTPPSQARQSATALEIA